MLELPFEPTTPKSTAIDTAMVVAAIASNSDRPRYTYMVLDLIARIARNNGNAGPYVRQGEALVPIREWLAAVIAPSASRHHYRKATVEAVRRQLAQNSAFPVDPAEQQALVEAEVATRVRATGMTAVSRAVSELVRAGLIKRHYQGYRVDHQNRGAQRLAVYTVPCAVRKALGRISA